MASSLGKNSHFRGGAMRAAGSNRKRSRSILVTAAAAALGVLAVRTARADQETWTGSASGDWSIGGNWTGPNHTPPVNGDSLLFTIGAITNQPGNDDIAGLSVSGIQFDAGANSYVLATSGSPAGIDSST